MDRHCVTTWQAQRPNTEKGVEALKALEIRLSGTGGQGLALAGRVLAEAFAHEDKTVSQSQSYEPVSRGGVSTADLVVSEARPDYPLASSIDCLLILDQCAAGQLDIDLKPDALVLVDETRVTSPPEGDYRLATLPMSETARLLGNVRVANMVALGALIELGGICLAESCRKAIRERVPESFVELNLEAFDEGARLAQET